MNIEQASLLKRRCSKILVEIQEIHDEMHRWDYSFGELDHINKFKRYMTDTKASAISATEQADMIIKAKFRWIL